MLLCIFEYFNHAKEHINYNSSIINVTLQTIPDSMPKDLFSLTIIYLYIYAYEQMDEWMDAGR